MNSMNVVVKPLEQSEVEITISLPWEAWKKYADKAAKTIAKDVKIPGFRPGKVPQDVIEKKYGKEAILLEAADLAVQDSYAEALRQEKLETIGRPKAEIKEASEGKDLEYVVTTAVMPKATLKPWKDAVKKINKEIAAEKIEVSEEDVTKELERLAKTRAKFITVNRAAKTGDNVEVDFQVFRDGVIIENGTGKKHPLVLGSNTFIPGFEEHLIGMMTGDEAEFELSFPTEYHAKDLAGKTATFKVELRLVQERDVPAIDDVFAQSLGKFTTLDELKTNIKEGMLEEKKQQAQESHQAKIVEALIDLTEATLPAVMVEEETHKMIQEFEGQIQSMGMNLENYLKELGKTHKDLHTDWEPQAQKRLRAALALDEVAKDQDIEAAAEEVEAEMNKTLQYYKTMKDMEKKIDLEKLYNYVKGKMQNEKVFEYLLKL
jgi:trigger factor